MSINGVTGINMNTVDPTVFDSTLSPDALMTYLSTRLGAIDHNMDDIVNDQKNSQRVQEDIHQIQTALGPLNDEATDATEFPAGTRDQINAALDDIGKVDPVKAQQIADKLSAEGFINYKDDNLYIGSEVKATKTYVDNLGKDLESEAQMNMIHLQSIMSDRQTAIQLATNLISALGDSSKSIAANIGK